MGLIEMGGIGRKTQSDKSEEIKITTLSEV